MYERDRDDHAFLLVLAEAPRFTLAGWLWGREAKKPEWEVAGGTRRIERGASRSRRCACSRCGGRSMLILIRPTTIEVRDSAACPKCGAQIGEECFDGAASRDANHRSGDGL